jgi:tetratricopeptide (TPR) repeat protein
MEERNPIISRFAASPLLPGLAVAALAFLAYAWSLSFPLVWDDPILVGKALRAEAENGIAGFFTREYSTSRPDGYYRPLVMASFWADSLAGGGSSFPFHATNVLLHASNALLVFLILRRLVVSPWAASWGAALFALHPAHTEVAAFVSNRSDSWVAFFILLAGLLFATWAKPGANPQSARPPAWRYATPGGAALLLAALSKEPAFLFPAALLAVSWLESGRLLPEREIRRDLWPWVACLGGALALAAVLRVAVGHVGWGAPLAAASGPAAPGRALATAANLVRIMVLPLHQQAVYPGAQPAVTPLTWAGVLLFCALAVLTALAAGWRRAASCLAWTAVFLLPFLGFVRINAAAIADRFLYLPGIGLSLMAASLLSPLLESKSVRRTAAAAAAAVLVLFFAATTARIAVWSSEERLYRHIELVAPGISLSQNNLGIILGQEGRSSEAMARFQRALDISPFNPEGHYNLAVELMKAGRWSEAEEHFRRARSSDSTRAYALLGLGFVLVEQGKREEAREIVDILRTFDRAKAEQLGARLASP